MPKYEVIIKYIGADRYIVEAPDQQEAVITAKTRYNSNEIGENLFENINETLVQELTDE